MMKFRVAIPLLLAALTSCTLEPHYSRPEPAVSPQWPQITDQYPQSGDAPGAAPTATPSAAAQSDAAALKAADIGWREFFTDARLQKLIGIYRSPEVKAFILDRFNGSIIPAW